MLFVKTYLDKSAIQGIGLFAGEDIQKGRVIWQLTPEVDLIFDRSGWDNLLQRCSTEAKQQLRRHSYKEGQRFYLLMDNAQFLNHSNAPNMINGESSDINVAARDIQKGEELLCNYFEYCDHDDYNLAQISRQTHATGFNSLNAISSPLPPP